MSFLWLRIEILILPRSRNVAVYLANAAADSVLVRNRAEVLAALREPRVSPVKTAHPVAHPGRIFST